MGEVQGDGGEGDGDLYSRERAKPGGAGGYIL